MARLGKIEGDTMNTKRICNDCCYEISPTEYDKLDTLLCPECGGHIEEIEALNPTSSSLDGEKNKSLFITCESCKHNFSKRAQKCPKCKWIPTSICELCKNNIPLNSTECPECGDPTPFLSESTLHKPLPSNYDNPPKLNEDLKSQPPSLQKDSSSSIFIKATGVIAIIIVIAFALIISKQQKLPSNNRVSNQKELPFYNKVSNQNKLPHYSIIKDKKTHNIKRTIEIRLSGKISKDELRDIANKVKNSDPKEYDRTFILYYLPNQSTGHGAWATTHFNPNLKISILGFEGYEKGDTTELEEYMGQHSTWVKYKKEILHKTIPQNIVNSAIKTEKCTNEVWAAEDLGQSASKNCMEWHNHLRDYLKIQEHNGINFYDLPKEQAERIADEILLKMTTHLNE